MLQNRNNILTKQDMEKIHEASLSILSKTGMLIDHPTARNRLHEAGAHIDNNTKRVRFPAELVQEALRITPKKVTLAARNPEDDIVLDCTSPVKVRCATGATMMLVHTTGNCRPVESNDQKAFAVLADGLDQIDLSGCLTLQDVPKNTADLYAIKILIENQKKHFMALTLSAKNLKYQIEMQIVVRGSEEAIKKRPLFHPIASMISPLYLPKDSMEIIMLTGRYGLPGKIPVMPILGASAPVTLSGTITLANAEMLGANTVLQTLFPGTPMISYCMPMIMDMRSGAGLLGSYENMLIYAAVTKMGTSFYHLPTETTPFIGDSVVLEQIIHQKSTGILVSCFSGINIIGSAGSMDSGITASLAQLVIDDEIVCGTRKILEGFETSVEKIGLEAIDRIGPAGNFLSDNHTLSNLRLGEITMSTIFNEQHHSEMTKNPQSLYDKAQSKAAEILKRHIVPELERHIVTELSRIVEAANKELN